MVTGHDNTGQQTYQVNSNDILMNTNNGGFEQ